MKILDIIQLCNRIPRVGEKVRTIGRPNGYYPKLGSVGVVCGIDFNTKDSNTGILYPYEVVFIPKKYHTYCFQRYQIEVIK